MPKQQGDNVQTLEMKYLNLIFLVSVLDTSIVYILEFVWFFFLGFAVKILQIKR